MFTSSTTRTTPTLNLFGTSNNNTNPTNNTANTGGTSLFGKPAGLATSTTQPFGTAQNANQQSSLAISSSAPQIDITHIRSTTKFDHAQKLIQEEITFLDNAILNQQRQCDELADLLPSISGAAGTQLAPAIDFVSTKLEELEQGLENDAEAIVSLREGELRKDEGEVKCVFRNVDRLKVPRQYQVVGTTTEGAPGTSVLGASTMNGTGLSGWWNQPQALRGMRATSGIGGQSVQLVSDDLDDGSSHGPKTIIDLVDSRAEDFKKVNEQQKRLLGEIEDFVEGLEEKIIFKEREMNERVNYGNANADARREEQKERQMNQLRFVFGEVQRGLYEMADKVGTTRDGIVELGMMR